MKGKIPFYRIKILKSNLEFTHTYSQVIPDVIHTIHSFINSLYAHFLQIPHILPTLSTIVDSFFST